MSQKRWGGGSLQEPFAKNSPRPIGLPIGNLTSQLFANVYLNELDQFVKHTLRAQHYVRYMDDFIILHPSKVALRRALHDIDQFCNQVIHLQLHPKKTGIHKFHKRERFVGYDLAPFNRHLAKPAVKRFMRRVETTKHTKGTAAAQETWQQFQAYAEFAHADQLLRSISPFGISNQEGG